MNTSTWIFLILGVINTISTIWFILKVSMRLEKRITQIEKYLLEDINENQVDESISTGLVGGIQKLKNDDARHLQLLEMGRRLQTKPLGVMNQNSTSKRIDTGGELIPGNLTKEEEEILRMYYDRTNER